ncbi:MAG: hypothetical protein ABMA25_22515 [Ilumatobacteraceae bacterium]
MKFRSRILLAGATLFAAVGAVGASPAAAGPIVTPGPGDGSAVVFFANGGNLGFTNGFKYNSTGGGFDGGRIDATHYWVSFLKMGGGTYTNTQLTIWEGLNGPAVDPICTIDTTKDNGTDVTVYFQCTPFPPASLDGTSLFVNVTNRTHPDRAGVTAPGFVALTTASASAASSTPTNQYRSSGTGAAQVTRSGVGQYSVTVPNGAYAWNQGTAFVTALTVSPTVDTAYTRYCNLQSWYPSGTNTVVNVRCYMGAGTAADARFSLRLTNRNQMGGTQPGGSQWVSNPASAGYDTTSYRWNSVGGVNHVRSLVAWEGAGVSEVEFMGSTWASGRVPSLLVSGYGGNQRCSLKYQGYNTITFTTHATVRCFSPFTGAGLSTAQYTVGIAQF